MNMNSHESSSDLAKRTQAISDFFKQAVVGQKVIKDVSELNSSETDIANRFLDAFLDTAARHPEQLGISPEQAEAMRDGDPESVVSGEYKTITGPSGEKYLSGERQLLVVPFAHRVLPTVSETKWIRETLALYLCVGQQANGSQSSNLPDPYDLYQFAAFLGQDFAGVSRSLGKEDMQRGTYISTGSSVLNVILEPACGHVIRVLKSQGDPLIAGIEPTPIDEVTQNKKFVNHTDFRALVIARAATGWASVSVDSYERRKQDDGRIPGYQVTEDVTALVNLFVCDMLVNCWTAPAIDTQGNSNSRTYAVFARCFAALSIFEAANVGSPAMIATGYSELEDCTVKRGFGWEMIRRAGSMRFQTLKAALHSHQLLSLKEVDFDTAAN